MKAPGIIVDDCAGNDTSGGSLPNCLHDCPRIIADDLQNGPNDTFQRTGHAEFSEGGAAITNHERVPSAVLATKPANGGFVTRVFCAKVVVVEQ